MKRLTLIFVIAILTACGGGSDDESAYAKAQQTGSAVPTICLSGNSVMRGSYIMPKGEIRRSHNAPEFVLSWNFPQHVIKDYSINGSSVSSMRSVAGWAPQPCDAHVILHYHNDDPATFEAQLNAAINESPSPVKMLVIANTPTPPVPAAWANIDTNIETVRRVAAARGMPLCDLKMGSVDNASDGLHPNDTGYAVLSGGLVRCLRGVM